MSKATSKTPIAHYLLGCIVLIVAGIIYRIPYLINPYDYNSDFAVIGLQGLELHLGNWKEAFSVFQWMSGYSASIESLMSTLFYNIWGVGPHSFMAPSFVGYFLGVLIVYFMVLRTFGFGIAILLSLLLMFAPQPISQYSLFPSRGWCFTFAIFALAVVWSDKGDPKGKRLGLGVLLAMFSLFVDFLMIEFLPAILALAIMRTARNPPFRDFDLVKLRTIAIAFTIGGIFLLITRLWAPAGVPLAFSPIRLTQTIHLFFVQTLPTLFNVFPDSWLRAHEAGFPLLILPYVQIIAGLVVIFAVIWGAWLSIKDKSIPLRVRELSIVALLVWITCTMGFMGSSKADHVWSNRYLAPMYWMLPFALGPLFFKLKKPIFVSALSIFLVLSFLGGWRHSVPTLNSIVPVKTARGTAVDEIRLQKYLLDNDVHHAIAHYWEAYRLTHIYQKNPLVVPYNQVRYHPYQREFERASLIAEIFDEVDWNPEIERPGTVQIGRYRVFIHSQIPSE